MKKQKPSQSKKPQPDWGVLAPDPANQTFHKPDNFLSLIRAAQAQTARAAPDKVAPLNARPVAESNKAHKKGK